MLAADGSLLAVEQSSAVAAFSGAPLAEPTAAVQMKTTFFGSVSCFIAAVAASAGCALNDTPSPPPATASSPQSALPTQHAVGPLSSADARALAVMNDRLREYVDLHLKHERSLPRVPDDATPEQRDRNKTALRELMAQSRASAKPGDLFTAEARPVILRLLAQVFAGADGKQARASVMDENPLSGREVAVNAAFPDGIPMTSMPPAVLQVLPKLSEDLHYRFIGTTLVLLDTHAHMIADYITNAMPK